MSDSKLPEPSTSSANRQPRLRVQLVVGLATIFATTKLVLLFLFARIGFFVMDEFQQGGYARYIDEGFYETLWPFKTVLYAYYFRLSHLLGDSAQQILVFARMQGFLLAVVLCLLVYGVARRMSRPRVDSFLAVCALLSFSTFMERAYRLRSEPLATVLGMASLLVVARETRTWRRVAVAAPSFSCQ